MRSRQDLMIAVNRFGLGAKPGNLKDAAENPKQWLVDHLTAVEPDPELPDSSEISQAFGELKQLKLQAKADGKRLDKKYNRALQQSHIELSVAPVLAALRIDNSVSLRLFDFFSNHFSVSASGQLMKALAPTLEREAIGPNLLGPFEDMLLSVVKHPAMLIYLNNAKSIGPNSRIGNRRKKGLNENLAREILELHTLGVTGGYAQDDVVELAKAITGWTLENPKQNKYGFRYRPAAHEEIREINHIFRRTVMYGDC